MTLIFDLELDVPNMEIVGQGIQVLEHEQAGRHSFWSRVLDFDPVTSIYERAVAVLDMYLQINNKISQSKLSKVRGRTNTRRQTDRQTNATERITALYSRVVITQVQ